MSQRRELPVTFAFDVMPPVVWNVKYFIWFKGYLHAPDLAKSRKLAQVRVFKVHLHAERGEFRCRTEKIFLRAYQHPNPHT